MVLLWTWIFELGNASTSLWFYLYQDITLVLSALDSIHQRTKLSFLMRPSSRRYSVVLIQVWDVFSIWLCFIYQLQFNSLGNRIVWKGLHLEVQAWQQKILLLDAGQLMRNCKCFCVKAVIPSTFSTVDHCTLYFFFRNQMLMGTPRFASKLMPT